MLRKLAYWGEFDPADEQALLALPHRVKKIERQGYVVREREIATHSCVLLSGFAIRHKIVANGARQIVAVHMTGDVVDLQNSFLGVADHSVQVITEAEVAFIPLEVSSLAVAREEAVHGIRSLLAAEVINGSFNLDGRIDIKDARGDVLLTVPFKEAIDVKGA